ncbi:MAG: carboxypeptidase regulatory-like domain-containing protein [Blastocatellia bacterium]
MSVERNNTVNDFSDDFEAALRRHLKRVNAVAETCAGFDPELASAYVENALGTTARARFENHLSDCAACRRHVVELFRLMPPAERPVMTAEPAAAGKAGWLAGLFDFSGWRWNAATLAGACAVLMLAVGLTLVWQRAAQDNNAALVAARPEAQSDAPVPTVQATPAAPEAAGASANHEKATAQIKADSRTQAPAPLPSITPSVASAATPALPAARDTLALKRRADKAVSVRVSGPGGAAVPGAEVVVKDAATGQTRLAATTDSTGQASLVNLSQLRAGNYQIIAQAPGFVTRQTSLTLDGMDLNNEVTLRLEPRAQGAGAQQSRANETQAAAKAAPVSAAAADTTAKAETAARDEAKKSDDERRENPRGLNLPRPTPPPRGALAYKEPDKPAEPARSKAVNGQAGIAYRPNFGITQTVNGKTFRMEKGVWRDTAYNASDKWPVVHLTRGSEEFDQTIADIPSLRQFFTSLKGHVLVLWQGTVYEVK